MKGKIFNNHSVTLLDHVTKLNKSQTNYNSNLRDNSNEHYTKKVSTYGSFKKGKSSILNPDSISSTSNNNHLLKSLHKKNKSIYWNTRTISIEVKRSNLQKNLLTNQKKNLQILH